MKTADELWKDVEGFSPPDCPECGNAADLDADGYFCLKCSDSAQWTPAVDDIPNGQEFDEALAAYRKAAGLEG